MLLHRVACDYGTLPTSVGAQDLAIWVAADERLTELKQQQSQVELDEQLDLFGVEWD